MQKSPRFFDSIQTKSQKVLTDMTNDNVDISFQKLLQKSDQNISTSFDNIFRPIQIAEEKSLRSSNNKNLQIYKKQNRCNSYTGVGGSDKVEQMVQNSKLKMINKKLEYQLTLSKQKYKKGVQDIETKQKQQIVRLRKQNEELKKRIINYEEQRQKQKKRQNKIYQQFKAKFTTLQKQFKNARNEYKKQSRQKQEFKNKSKNLQCKVQQLQEVIGQLDKKLRIKQKQMAKIQQIQNERDQYYQNIFNQKENQIQRIKIQYTKKAQQFYLENQQYQCRINKVYKQVEELLKQNRVLTQQMEEKKALVQRMSSVITQGITLLQEHLKQLTKGSNYSTRSTRLEKNAKLNKNYNQQANFKLLTSLIMELIEKINSIRSQNNLQLKNFKQKYEDQLFDLDKKVSFLAEENRHLKMQKDGLKTNIELNYTSNCNSHRQIVQKDIFNQVQQKQLLNQVKKLKSNIKQVQKHRQLNNSQSHTKLIFATNQKLYQPKAFIKQVSIKQLDNIENCRIKQQIQRAKKVFNDVVLNDRSYSVKNLRNSQRHQSESYLHKRTRNSLSWKKPSQILKQYI